MLDGSCFGGVLELSQGSIAACCVGEALMGIVHLRYKEPWERRVSGIGEALSCV